MQQFKDNFVKNHVQSQVFTLLLVVIILVVFAIVVYTKVKKQQPDKAPTGIVFLAEQYVMGVEKLYQQTTGGKINKAMPYIFTLLTMVALGNLMGLLGFDPVSTTYSYTLTLALVSFIGIYVVGIIYQKWRFIKKYTNPLELIGQFSPLISLSFRMFGNIIGGTTIMYLIYNITGWVWGFIPVVGQFNLMGPIIAPVLHMYFDIFSGLIQAFVFSLLTLVYWTLEAEHHEPQTKQEQTTTRSNVKQKTVRS